MPVKKVNLGKRLKVADTFISVSKKMHKGGRWPFTPLFKMYKKGDTDFFIKGKRKYFCVVLGLQETRTGICMGSVINTPTYNEPIERGLRYWQFSYLVKILEN